MSSQPLSSVTNALRILKCFSREERELGVSELARRLGIAKSTTHRLLSTLAAEGFVRRTDDAHYALGIKLWELGSLMVEGLDIREVARPILERLRDDTGETVHMAILEGTDVVYIARFDAPNTLALSRRVGHRMPAHATSTGKAILAFSADDVVERVIAGGLDRLAGSTITSREDFLARLSQIRGVGWASSSEESESGVASVGAPVFDHRGAPVGAVSGAGPVARRPAGNMANVGRQARAAADQISQAMGRR